MIDKIRTYLALREDKKKIEKELALLKEKIKILESEMSEEYVENGVSSIAVDGMNVSIVEKKSIKCDQSPWLVNYLEENGFNEVFNKPVNNISLGKLIKENPEIIDEIASCIEVTDYYMFQVRKK